MCGQMLEKGMVRAVVGSGEMSTNARDRDRAEKRRVAAGCGGRSYVK